jgi:hypothetical protein
MYFFSIGISKKSIIEKWEPKDFVECSLEIFKYYGTE